MNSNGTILYRHKLGTTLSVLGNRQICEGGICDKKIIILWDEIDTLFLEATKTTLNFVMPAGEEMKLQVVSKTGNRITLQTRGLFRIGGGDKDNFSNIHQFVVSKIIDRQCTKLISDIKEGKRVSFQSFDITSNAIYRKKFFGGYDIIESYRIVGCDLDNGEFIIVSIDNKGELNRKRSGQVSGIPNIHLAHTFLLSIAQHNLEIIKSST